MSTPDRPTSPIPGVGEVRATPAGGEIHVRFIQELLGHASVRTTEIYTHVSRRHIERIRSPFDEPQGEEPRKGE